jgi:hypothetical protein
MSDQIIVHKDNLRELYLMIKDDAARNYLTQIVESASVFEVEPEKNKVQPRTVYRDSGVAAAALLAGISAGVITG